MTNAECPLRELIGKMALWLQRAHDGPDYGGLTRDTHPLGEKIWREWFDGNVNLCNEVRIGTREVLVDPPPCPHLRTGKGGTQ